MSQVAPLDPSEYPIMEFRRYTLHPGRRETLIELFECEFIAGQEDVGMYINGQFRNLDDPDQFVWLRSFPDMEARKTALKAFYSGPVWQAHRDVANATLIDSDNVFLLHPARVGTGFMRLEGRQHEAGAIVVAEIFPLVENHAADFSTFFERDLEPVLLGAGALTLASYLTEPSTNTFPRLPVRTDTTVFIWFSCFSNEVAYARYRRTLERSLQERHELMNQLASQLQAETESLRLSSTDRSRLRP